ncbi:MAG TPA: MucR family transcriptional regulator [Mesorhizobium sp.]|jgi:predicted transcriptional regulator|nr:MucR family transcriptional regulator [Mesorhizobium sp.]
MTEEAGAPIGATDIELTADIVSTYVAHNTLAAAELPKLIADVKAALSSLSSPQPEAPPAPTPAVNPKKSVFPDYIVSLEDGKRYKSLKRHLMSKYGMTPQDYRAKWSLPADYPMVAPSYSATRSELAKNLGLGRKREAAAPAPAKRGRAKKAA